MATKQSTGKGKEKEKKGKQVEVMGIDSSQPKSFPFFDVEQRLMELEEMMEEKNLDPDQKNNINAAVKMYETKELPPPIGTRVYIQDGKILPGFPDSKKPYLAEGMLMQMMQQLAQTEHQFQNSVAYNLFPALSGHQMLVDMRLLPRLGGDGTTFRTSILNDTGSSALTVLVSDLAAMNLNGNTYQGQRGTTPVQTSNGVMTRLALLVEIQLLHHDGRPCSNWIEELAIVQPITQGNIRLSGATIRQSLYFATAPGNQFLYVAEKKNGIVTQLPVV